MSPAEQLAFVAWNREQLAKLNAAGLGDTHEDRELVAWLDAMEADAHDAE